MLGILVRLKFPAPLRRALNRQFARLFKLDLSEAALPLESYHTIEEVFIRTLKTDARRWVSGLSSPADGTVLYSAPLAAGARALQVKGITYSVNELIYGSGTQHSTADSWQPHWFTTVYLAPHNYHRVHTPLAGTLTCIRYIPGTLWPVNERFTRLIPGLLCQNERLVFELTTPKGGKMAIVMVGAYNVGRILSSHAPELTTNTSVRQLRGCSKGLVREKIVAIPLATAAELGIFMLGSTVVVVSDEATTQDYAPRQINSPELIKVGESL
jgi:phosphatidylserine decarboxylase